MSTPLANHLAALQAAIGAMTRVPPDDCEATFNEARRQYLDMRTRGIPFPPDLTAELDAFFGCAS